MSRGTRTETPSRRSFLLAGAALAFTELAGCGREPETPRAAPPADLSATEAIRRMRSGEMSAESYAEALLARADAEARLNAFITIDREKVLAAARGLDALRRSGKASGPLHGLPVALKDVIDTASVRTTYATASLKDHVPRESAPVVDRLLAAGAVILGKTNCDELNFGSASQSSAFGGVKNPFDVGAVPGGSSGGSAAAVGARVLPVAIGADTTGSIRMPAALCGAKGFRPSTGRYPTAGVWPISPTMDALGPIGRFVDDLMLFDRVLSSDPAPFPEVALPGLRVGVPRRHFFDRIDDAELLAVVEKALGALRGAGAILVEADFPDAVLPLLEPFAVAYPILFAEARAAMNAFIAERGIPLTLEQVYAQFTPDVKGLFDQFVFANPSPFDLEKSLRDRQTLIAAYNQYFSTNQVALLVFPATPFTAPKIGQAKVRFNRQDIAPFDVIENSTAAGSAVGNPGVTIPIGKANGGLPVGLQIEALAGRDRQLLAAAKAMEPIFARAG